MSLWVTALIATDRCHELDSEAMNEVAARCLEQIAMEVVLVAGSYH